MADDSIRISELEKLVTLRDNDTILVVDSAESDPNKDTKQIESKKIKDYIGAYTKAETNNLLSEKANTSDVYTKSNIYSKSETENLIRSEIDVHDTNATAHGDIRTQIDNLSDRIDGLDIGGTPVETPTKLSQLENDEGFITQDDLPEMQEPRDFITNPIDLESETTGVLPIGNVDVSSIQSQIDTINDDISEHDTRITALEAEKHFNWRGQFQLGNTYNTYDVVRAEDGNDYIATTDGLVLSPPSSGWDLFLEGGNSDTPTLPENIATLEDIDVKISEHNLNEDSHQDIRDLIADIEVGEGRDFTENPIDLESEVTGILPIENVDTSSLFSGEYEDLENKPDIPEIPENVSEFTNDVGYVTSVPYDDEGINNDISFIRDFFENPINLGTEVTGKLPVDNMDVPALADLIPVPVFHQTTGQDTLGGMSQKAITDALNSFPTGDGEIRVTTSVPDYANQESTSRISANNGTWTVDRDGFVNCLVNAYGSGTELAGYFISSIWINDKIVDSNVGRCEVTGINVGLQARVQGVYPVKKGDIVKFTIDAGNATLTNVPTDYQCFYIPSTQIGIAPVTTTFGTKSTGSTVSGVNSTVTYTATEDCYVQGFCQVSVSGTGNTYCGLNMTISGVNVWNNTDTSQWTGANVAYTTPMILVKKGAVITLTDGTAGASTMNKYIYKYAITPVVPPMIDIGKYAKKEEIPAIAQVTGSSSISAMSQKAVTDMVNTMGDVETITCNITDLQATIDKLPKFLNHDVVINVNAGITTDDILVQNFVGQGSIAIYTGTALGTTHTVNSIRFYRNNCSHIILRGLNFTATTGNAINFQVNGIAYAHVTFCRAVGGAPTTVGNIGLMCDCTNQTIIENCEFSNKESGIQAKYSRVTLGAYTANNNKYGVYSFSGGMVQLRVAPTITNSVVSHLYTSSGGVISEVSDFRVLTTNLTKAVDLADLQAEINALPKLLLADVTFNVTSGNITSEVVIERFTGMGRINIIGSSAIDNTHNVLRFRLSNCTNNYIRVSGFRITSTDNIAVNCNDCCGKLTFERLRISGGSPDTNTNRGIMSAFCPTVFITDCEINDKYAAISPREGSMFVQGATGANNKYKFWPTLGGSIYQIANTNTIAGEILTNTAGLLVNISGGVIGT